MCLVYDKSYDKDKGENPKMNPWILILIIVLGLLWAAYAHIRK